MSKGEGKIAFEFREAVKFLREFGHFLLFKQGLNINNFNRLG